MQAPLKKEGCENRIAPMSTLSQNGYGANHVGDEWLGVPKSVLKSLSIEGFAMHKPAMHRVALPMRYTGGSNRSTQAESQWIVAQRLLSALTIPGSN